VPTLKLYELQPSPNCTQVRLALGAKGVPFESVALMPSERTPILEEVGVALTPGIRWGDIKLYDSRAIIRFIDLNFAGPRLFPVDEDQLREVESWERWAREDGIAGLGAAFAIAVGRSEFDQDVLDRAREELTASTARVEQTLAEQPYLVGDALSAADLIVASRMVLVHAPEPIRSALTKAEFPLWPFFWKHCGVAGERPHTQRWLSEIFGHDSLMQGFGIAPASS